MAKKGKGQAGLGGLAMAIAEGRGKSSTLKQGESMNPGKGLAVVRYASVSDGGSRKPSGGGGARSQVPIYGRVDGGGAGGSQAAGGAVADPFGSGLKAPNDGTYGNITSNLEAQARQGRDEAKKWANMQAQVDTTNARIAAEMQAQSDQQSSALQALAIQQQQAYDQQIALQQQQIAAAQAAAAEQKRQAEALSRAYVPELQATATAPSTGDNRPLTGGGTNAATLSSLSILTGTGLGQAAIPNTLAGLQIA